MRVTFDTNVLVSAFHFPGGPPEDVFRLALEGQLELITSPPLLAELNRVLTKKLSWDPAHAEEAVAQVARHGIVVRPNQRLDVIRDDPTDNRVLEAAVEGGAGVICSGDRHLVRLGEWRGIRVLRPAHLLEEFESS